jgi:hypothetical protein
MQVQVALQGLSRLQWQVMKRDLNIPQVTRASCLATLTTPSQIEVPYKYLQSMLADEGRVDGGELISISNDGNRLQSAASAEAMQQLLASVLHEGNSKHAILGYLDTMDARKLRRASTDCKEAQLYFTWNVGASAFLVQYHYMCL